MRYKPKALRALKFESDAWMTCATFSGRKGFPSALDASALLP